jgi:PH/SEC7 domain-containing protein
VDRHFQAAPAFGFASNLTHEVIREHDDEAASITESFTTDTTEDMTDDQLALLGPPWAKEGNLQRKPYWEAPGKRSKEKNWKQVFTVLQQGDVYMFSFDGGSGRAAPKGAAMGGGNWMVSLRVPHAQNDCTKSKLLISYASSL